MLHIVLKHHSTNKQTTILLIYGEYKMFTETYILQQSIGNKHVKFKFHG